MKAQVDTHIRIKLSDVNPNVIDLLKTALTFPNEEKIAAQKEMIRGWEGMPDHVFLWKLEEDELVLPRGFATQLKRGLKNFHIDVEWDDQRVISPTDFSSMSSINLRPYQVDAVANIIKYTQGIVQAPPGAGKTVTMLEAIRRIGQQALVITDKTNIAEQWRQRSRDFLNYEPGLIGDNQWDERPFTVCLQQTLWSKINTLGAAWYEQWGMVLLDECHHAPARTFQEVLQKFPSYYRLGTSATPEKGQNLIPMAQAVIGDIFHVTTRDELVNSNVLIKPSVVIVRSSFTYPYHSTFSVGQYDLCPLKYCKRTGRHFHRNNYQAMMSKLIDDEERNGLIAERIMINEGCANIILSRRLAHLNNISNLIMYAGWPADRIHFLTGKETREERMYIAELADEADIAIFSTIADEALDIPRLDRIYLTWPTRNTDTIRQQIGRIERFHPLKTDAIVYDFIDPNVPVLLNQYRRRRREVYKPEGLEVEGSTIVINQ